MEVTWSFWIYIVHCLFYYSFQSDRVLLVRTTTKKTYSIFLVALLTWDSDTRPLIKYTKSVPIEFWSSLSAKVVGLLVYSVRLLRVIDTNRADLTRSDWLKLLERVFFYKKVMGGLPVGLVIGRNSLFRRRYAYQGTRISSFFRTSRVYVLIMHITLGLSE